MVDEIKSLIKGDIGRKIIFFESIDSTNTRAMELAEKGSPHGTVVIADSQTKGRGRLGRTWVSPPESNIYMSIILRLGLQPKDATLLTIMAGVACAIAIMDITGLEVKIKWPNDLIASGKKLGGILTEMKSEPTRIIFAVVGIGINVNIKVADFPPDIQFIATSIREELGEIKSRTLIAAEILKEIEQWYKVMISNGKEQLLDECRRLSSILGREVSITTDTETFTGIAQDIDDGGMLILRLPSEALKKIHSGDVALLR